MNQAGDAARIARAAELHQQAVAASSAARSLTARRLLRRATTALTPRGEPLDEVRTQEDVAPVLVRILVTTAKIEADLGYLDRSLAVLDEAIELADAIGDRSVDVPIRNQRGVLFLRFGRLDDALAEFDLAEPSLPGAQPLDRCNVLLNRGVCHLDLGHVAEARRDFARCASEAEAAGLSMLEAMAEHNRGYTEFLVGNLVAALAAMQHGMELSDAIPLGVSYLDRARVLVEAGLVSAADRSLASAADIFAVERNTQDLAETELERARCALVASDVDAARRLAMRARDRFRRRGNDRWRRSAELVLLQGDLAAGRPGRRLSGPALRLREEFERDGVRLPARTAGLIAAEAHLSAGQVDAAHELVVAAGRVGPRDPITARLHAHYVRARLELAERRPAAASRRTHSALAELAAYQASFGSIDLATAAAVHGRRLAELDLSIALASARPEVVLDAAERGRAVSNRLPPVRPPDDPQTAELLGELRRTVETLRSLEQEHAAAASLARAPPRTRGADRGPRVDPARRRGRARHGRCRAAAGGARCDDAGLVLARGRRRCMRWSCRGDALRLVPLGAADAVDEQVRRVRADLDVLAQPRLPGPLQASVAASLARSLTDLDARLLGPVDVATPIVVVTTGLLGQLPWGLLPSLAGRAGRRGAVGDGVAHARRRPPAARGQAVAVSGPGLARGPDEAAEVAQIWRGRVVGGHQARGAEVVASLADARLVHVAAHGVHQNENPLFSSLRLADGPLFAHELDQSATAPEHVVLSACELGLATVRPGDEALGLTSVFLHLGTRSVVAGVGRVGDELAADTMIDYHRRLARGGRLGCGAGRRPGRRGRAPFVCFGAASLDLERFRCVRSM